MDLAQIPQRVADPAPSLSLPAWVDSKAFDVDDILIEILLRLSFPTTLVRAALVCKRWFRHASNPAFLRRFRELHPPRILGFFVHHTLPEEITHFVPMLPQPLELEAAVRHADLIFDNYKSMCIHIVDLENDDDVPYTVRAMTSNYAEAVHKLMSSDGGMTIFPQLPPCQIHLGFTFCVLNEIIFEEEGDSLSYFYVWIESPGQFIDSTVHVYKLQDGSWCRLTSIILTNQNFMPRDARRPLLVDKKIYIESQRSILVLDLTTSGFSIIQLPQGVEYQGDGDTMLSRVDDESGVYLIHTNQLQLDIWHHNTDNWLLVNTIRLHEMFAAFSKSDHTFEFANLSFPLVSQVGKNVEYVFLQLGWSLLYLDVKCRTLRKVYEAARDDARALPQIHPLMMIWPPAFPALMDDQASTDAT